MSIMRWRRALSLDKHEAIYQQLFSGVNGFELSRQARQMHDAMEYVYGEIDFISFIALLSLTQPDKQTIFYDLGSGTGTAVLACAMVFDVRESHGIELFSSLHAVACRQQKALSQHLDYAAKAKTIHFTHNNFLHADLSHATLIFINATGFFGQTWSEISLQLEQMSRCTTVITTSKALKSPAFTVIKRTAVLMSWGTVNAYIHKRVKMS